MESKDIKHLIKKAVTPGRSVWADFGSGDGAFTLRLRELGGPEMEIYSVDSDVFRLGPQQEMFEREFPDAKVHFMNKDFTVPLELPAALDGILMANSFHFIKEKDPVLRLVRDYLKPGGKFVIVEYDTNKGNFFVPYPLSFKALAAGPFAAGAGFDPPSSLQRSLRSIRKPFMRP